MQGRNLLEGNLAVKFDEHYLKHLCVFLGI